MKNKIIKSKGGSQFHPMIPVVLFLCCVPAFSSGSYVILAIIVALMAVTLFLDKTISVDIEARKCKEGLFSSWEKLAAGGYISIFSETSGQKLQGRIQATTVISKELKLNYIQGKTKKQLFTAKTRVEAERVAMLIANSWNIGVYDAASQDWLKEKTT